jgi:hypothetical protein
MIHHDNTPIIVSSTLVCGAMEIPSGDIFRILLSATIGCFISVLLTTFIKYITSKIKGPVKNPNDEIMAKITQVLEKQQKDISFLKNMKSNKN